jgi:hypothetical protein
MSQRALPVSRPKTSFTAQVIAFVLFLIVALIWFWNWDWFIPVIDSEASAAIGRKVTIQHLQVSLGRITQATVTGVAIANPEGFSRTNPDLATIDRIVFDADLMGYIRNRIWLFPVIEIDHPAADVRELPDGSGNYRLHLANRSGNSGSPPQIGRMVIKDGAASIVMPDRKTDFNLTIQTQAASAGDEIVVNAHGTYSGQPVTGRFVGGALLSLRDPSNPYPVDLHIQNGATQVALTGTIRQPLTFGGADLKLSFSGQDMADLYPLTGLAIPATPPYSISGRLDYSKSQIRFENFDGRLGSSDLEGTIIEQPGAERPLVTANLTSRRVDLTDLGGFIGATPGKTTTPGQDEATKDKMAQANASPTLLPDQPINLPKINIANVELHYTGEHIINRDVPLDNVVIALSLENGKIRLHPLSFAVGTGSISSNVDLNPIEGVLHTNAKIEFRQLPLARLMASTHAFAGDGVVGGAAHLTGSGDSMAQILGHGNGGLQLFMNQGGDVSALLVDLAGLQVGDAVLSALGIPNKTKIQCLVSDFTLTDGIVNTKALLIATSEANILGAGTVDLTNEKLALALRTQATHFSIFSLSTPININGTMKHPSVLPAAGPLAARAGSAIGLGILFPPLALLPTIRLGLGDKNACNDTLTSLHQGHPHNPQ